jgi:deoxyribodipyrimidine photo-lyase
LRVQGRAGGPVVDDCVAMLRDTGWLNLRLRVLLVSVAAYPLWRHWAPVARWLARQFPDHEPGIHGRQRPMQSGTAGINPTRVATPSSRCATRPPLALPATPSCSARLAQGPRGPARRRSQRADDTAPFSLS